MSRPNVYTNKNETGCCAIPDVAPWSDQEITFEKQQFIRMHTRSFLFVPLNMGKVMKSLCQTATDAGASLPAEETLILSRDISPWKAEQLYAVSHPVDGADNVTLSGTFLTKVFEGPYKNAKDWYKTLQNYAIDKGKIVQETYFCYTTCPKCAKRYGNNYVIGLAKVA